MLYASLPRLSGPLRLEALQAFGAAYREMPKVEHLYLVALVLWRPLDRFCEKYEAVVSPSEVLARLGQGLQRNKRAPMRWLKKWADKLMAKLGTQGLLVETLPDVPSIEVTPSDPWLKELIELHWAKLAPREQETAELLYKQGLNQKEAAKQLNISVSVVEKRAQQIRTKLKALRDL